jgi:hypothetical protein
LKLKKRLKFSRALTQIKEPGGDAGKLDPTPRAAKNEAGAENNIYARRP